MSYSGMAEPDAILRHRPEFVTERPTLPADVDPDELRRRADWYAAVEKSKPGYILGRWLNPHRRGESVYVVDRSDRFCGLFMPTRSGKGVSFAFPNALSWSQSLFLNDPKRELCAGTAWWRRHGLGQRIFIIEPFATDGRNARFNPLAEIRKGTKYEETDAANIATAIVDPDGSGFDGDAGVWKKRARTLLQGLILHVLYTDEYREKSLRTVDAILSDTSTDIKSKYQRIKSAIHDPEGRMFWRNHLTGEPTRTHPVVAASMQDQIDRPEGEGGSVKSEMQSFTEVYRNPVLGDNSANSDFTIADVMDGAAPATVYFVVTPDSLELCKPYIRLFLNLLINRNVGAISFAMDGRQKKIHRYKLGMILDEFTSTLGRLDVFARQLAFVAGYGIKPVVIVQDMEQLIETYGQNQNVVSNLHTLVFGATNNLNSAEFFSKVCGDATFYRAHGRGQQYQTTPEGVPLISPSQTTRIPRDEAVVKMAHYHPLPVKKLKYYADDSNFSEKVRRADFASDRLPVELQAGYELRRVLQREYAESQRASFDASRHMTVRTVAAAGDIAQLHMLNQRKDGAAEAASYGGARFTDEADLLAEIAHVERGQTVPDDDDGAWHR